MKLLEEFGAGCSILAVVLLESIAVSWFYGKRHYYGAGGGGILCSAVKTILLPQGKGLDGQAEEGRVWRGTALVQGHGLLHSRNRLGGRSFSALAHWSAAASPSKQYWVKGALHTSHQSGPGIHLKG